MHDNNDFSALLKGVQALTKAVGKKLSASDRKVIGKKGKEVTTQIFKGDAFIQGPTTLVMVKVIGT